MNFPHKNIIGIKEMTAEEIEMLKQLGYLTDEE